MTSRTKHRNDDVIPALCPQLSLSLSQHNFKLPGLHSLASKQVATRPFPRFRRSPEAQSVLLRNGSGAIHFHGPTRRKAKLKVYFIFYYDVHRDSLSELHRFLPLSNTLELHGNWEINKKCALP